VRDFATVAGEGTITPPIAVDALKRLGVDTLGLDKNDHRYLHALTSTFAGGPVGLSTIAAAIGESEDTLEDVVEPYLLQLGFIQRTPRGRIATEAASRHLDAA
jgi:Holliday junction DNA helicase RuvB